MGGMLFICRGFAGNKVAMRGIVLLVICSLDLVHVHAASLFPAMLGHR